MVCVCGVIACHPAALQLPLKAICPGAVKLLRAVFQKRETRSLAGLTVWKAALRDMRFQRLSTTPSAAVQTCGFGERGSKKSYEAAERDRWKVLHRVRSVVACCSFNAVMHTWSYKAFVR